MTALLISYRNSFFTLALKVNCNGNENENQGTISLIDDIMNSVISYETVHR